MNTNICSIAFNKNNNNNNKKHRKHEKKKTSNIYSITQQIKYDKKNVYIECCL